MDFSCATSMMDVHQQNVVIRVLVKEYIIVLAQHLAYGAEAQAEEIYITFILVWFQQGLEIIPVMLLHILFAV